MRKRELDRVPVLVTTEHRGVFFGYLNGGLPERMPSEIMLSEARMCVYWSDTQHGVLGLASIGPDDNCRIGPAVPTLRLSKVTAVAECTAAAALRWGAAPWRN